MTPAQKLNFINDILNEMVMGHEMSGVVYARLVQASNMLYEAEALLLQECEVAAGLHEVRNWVNDLEIPRPKGTAHISMVLAQAMSKLGMLE